MLAYVNHISSVIIYEGYKFIVCYTCIPMVLTFIKVDILVFSSVSRSVVCFRRNQPLTDPTGATDTDLNDPNPT